MGILSKIFGTSKPEIGPDGKVICRKCHSRILPKTYIKFGGKCAPCANGQVVSKERIGENEKINRRINELGADTIMADYSFVKDAQGQIHGMWIKKTELVHETAALMTLLKMNEDQPIKDYHIDKILSKKYRIVPNTIDNQGGCFIMFDEELAPGEENNNNDQNVQSAYESIDNDRLIEMLLQWAKDMVWKCPKCTAILEKKRDSVLSELFGHISGINTCNNCGTSLLSDDVYGSKYDITIEEFRSIAGDKLIDRGVKLIIDIIEDTKKDSNTRIEAIAVVAKIGGKNIIDILKPISKDQNQAVQMAAKEALEKLGKKQEQELLKDGKVSDEKKNEGNISQNRINQPLGFFYCPINDPAVCSDDGCPCGPVSIPYGGGYLYISQSAVDFRKDARSDAELKVKGAAYIKSLQQGGKTAVVLDPTIYKAILICEEAAKRRRLNLQVAAADAKYAWETAQAPLRPTPSYKSQESVNESYETDNNLIRDIHFFIEIPGIEDNINPNDMPINVPNEFIDFADKELKLNGNLNSFVQENIDKIRITKLKKLEDFEKEKSKFYSKYAESTNWETYYRSTEAGYRFSILVEYNFPKPSWVQDFIDETLADTTFQKYPEYQKKTNEDSSKKDLEIQLVEASGKSTEFWNGNIDKVKRLIAEGVDINARNYSKTALMEASIEGHLDIVKVLLNSGADANIIDWDGRTAVMFASQNGQIGIVKKLLENGADLLLEDNDGDTALIKASRWGRDEIVSLIIERTSNNK